MWVLHEHILIQFKGRHVCLERLSTQIFFFTLYLVEHLLIRLYLNLIIFLIRFMQKSMTFLLILPAFVLLLLFHLKGYELISNFFLVFIKLLYENSIS